MKRNEINDQKKINTTEGSVSMGEIQMLHRIKKKKKELNLQSDENIAENR